MSSTLQPKNWFQRNFGWVALIVIGLGILGDAVSGAQVILRVIDYLSFIHNPPVWFTIIFLLLGLMGLGVFIFYANKNTIIPKPFKIFAITAISLSLILVPQIFYETPNKKFVLVYDEIKPTLFFSSDTVMAININEVAKLHQINQLENATILSTVSQPEVQWKRQFPQTPAFDSPIFSIQEILNPVSKNLVDISLASYHKEISQFIVDNKLESNEIRVFYENGFGEIATRLRENIKNKSSNSKVNCINLNPDDSKSLFGKNIVAVYIGANDQFPKFESSLKTNDYKFLVLPNWLLSSLSKCRKTNTKNRYCITKSYHQRLIKNDTELWAMLFALLKGEEKNISKNGYSENLKNKILSSFGTDNNLLSINF